MFNKENKGINWDLLYSYMVLAKHGKMRKAASTLNMSVSTLSRRMEKLELELNMSLFRRHSNGVALTEEGIRLADHCKILDSSFAEISQAMRHTSTSSRKIVRCSIVADIARFVVLPNLQDFYENHADTMLELDTSMQLVDLANEDWDLAIRFSRPEKGALIVKRLASTKIRLYRHKSLSIDVNGTIPFIGWRYKESDFLPNKLTNSLQDRNEVLRVSDFSEVLAAMQAGVGTGFMPDYVAKALGDFEPVDLPNSHLYVDVWMVVREASARVPHVKEFMSFITGLLSENEKNLAAS